MAFTHKNNSDFQNAYFLAGKAHTADEAYRIISNQREDRSTALKVSEAGRLRTEAKRARARAVLENEDSTDAEQLDAQADLAEIDAYAEVNVACIEGAIAELAFLDKLLALIEPHRKYKHLPDAEAHEACQREEWCFELMHRLENYFFTTGNVPPEQLDAMRLHPDFERVIEPYIPVCLQRVRSQKGVGSVLKKPEFIKAIEKALLPAGVAPGLLDNTNGTEHEPDYTETDGIEQESN